MRGPDVAARRFREVAARVDGAYGDRSPGRPPVPWVQKRLGDWILTLERTRTDSGTYTQLSAPFHNPRGVRVRLRREGTLGVLLKTLGFVTDLEAGDPSFDNRFLVTGAPHRVLREILARERVRTLLEAMDRVDVRTHAGMSSAGYPDGIHILRSRWSGWIIPSVEELTTAFELFQEILPVLCPREAGWEDDPGFLVTRLVGPGGTVRSHTTNVVLWEGDPPRRDAARRLARFGGEKVVEALLSATGDRDDELVAAAADALGKIGDERAVPRLMELLGERRREAAGQSLAGHAADALRRLGRGAVVDAFEAALAGEPGELRPVEGAERAALVRALMDVVDSAEFGPRAEAARALGALGAREALPLLRSKSSAWGMRTSLTEAAGDAVTEIESRAALPRPAERPSGDAGSLPRPADAPDSLSANDERLPRPADALDPSGANDESLPGAADALDPSGAADAPDPSGAADERLPGAADEEP